MNRAMRIAAACIATLIFTASSRSDAAEIRVLAALGFKEVIDELRPKFEKTSGHTLIIVFDTMGGAVKRLQSGANADVVIIPQQGIDEAGRKLVSGSPTVIARSGIAVAIRKGANKPDISTPDTLRKTLLAAKSITYGNPADGGASGIHFAKVLERLGIANEMKPKTIFAKAGTESGEFVANGKAELGINQLQVLIAVSGIDIAGPLPGELQATTVFSAAATTIAKETGAVKALISFLRTPEAATVIKAKGMEPS